MKTNFPDKYYFNYEPSNIVNMYSTQKIYDSINKKIIIYESIQYIRLSDKIINLNIIPNIISKTKPYFFYYWDNIDGKETPEYIQMCHETFHKNAVSFNVVKLNSSNIKQYLPILNNINNIEKLKIAHKVDIYRILLLETYGGIYFDSDIILLKDPIDIYDKLQYYDYVGFGCTGPKCNNRESGPSNWAMCARQNSMLMKAIKDYQMNILINYDDYNFDENYHLIGKDVIWEKIDTLENMFQYEYYHFDSKYSGNRTSDGDWITYDYHYSTQDMKLDESELIFFVLYNSNIPTELKKLSRKDLLSSNINISRIFRKAIHNE
jgi:mannosyltransferase OCH1-like enzyme